MDKLKEHIKSIITGNPTFVDGAIDNATEEIANYYETAIIPQKVKEAEKKLIEEIKNLSYKTCGYDCKRCLPMKEICTWWRFKTGE
jgi:hypothetical protein